MSLNLTVGSGCHHLSTSGRGRGGVGGVEGLPNIFDLL